MHRRRNNSEKAKSNDPEQITQQYNECVEEIRKEMGVIGNLALHQEAMKRMAQRKSEKEAEEEATFDEKPQLKKRLSMDSLASFLFGDEDLSDEEVSLPAPLPSVSNSLRQNSIAVREMYPRSSSKLGGVLSNAIRYSTRSLSISASAASSSPNCSVSDLTHAQVIRRRDSAAISGYDEAIAINNALKDLELSDSEAESDLSDEEGRNKSIGRNGGGRRGSLRRRTSLHRTSSVRGSMRRRSSGLRGSLRGSVTKVKIPINRNKERRSSVNTDFSDESLPEQVSNDAPQNRRSSISSQSSGGSGPRFVRPSTDEESSTDNNKQNKYTVDTRVDFDAAEFGEKSVERERGGRPMPHRQQSRRGRRRSSLFSVDEDAVPTGTDALRDISNPGLDGSIESRSLGDSFSARDGSLICGWGNNSFNSSFVSDAGGGNAAGEDDDLICGWGRRGSMLSNSTSSIPEEWDLEGRNVGESPKENENGVIEKTKKGGIRSRVPNLINFNFSEEVGVK